MSSPAAVVGLTYRGTDVQDIDGIFLELVHGLTEVPQVRGVDLIVPGAVGRPVRNRVADRHGLELRGWMRGSGAGADAQRADYVANRAALRALFDPTLDPGPLVATLEDGSEQTIGARTMNILADERVPTFCELSIELESVDPDWVAGVIS